MRSLADFVNSAFVLTASFGIYSGKHPKQTT
jgi:hypothetical protein